MNTISNRLERYVGVQVGDLVTATVNEIVYWPVDNVISWNIRNTLYLKISENFIS